MPVSGCLAAPVKQALDSCGHCSGFIIPFFKGMFFYNQVEHRQYF